MRKDFLRTLFSRMLITYMTVTLGLMLVIGVTVAALLHAQMTREKKQELSREVQAVSVLYAAAYPDMGRLADTADELILVSRHYDGLIEVVLSSGAQQSYYEAARWRALAGRSYTEAELRSVLVSASEQNGAYTKRYSELAGFPVLTASQQFALSDGTSAVALMHIDLSPLETSIRSIYVEVLLIALMGALIGIIVVYSTTTQLTKPFLEINDIVQRYSKGDYNARIPISSTKEATQLAVSFNSMADQLVDLEATRRSFVANVSHELRSPLTSMKGFLEAMQDGVIGPGEYEKYIGIVLSETKRMAAMVNDLLDLARIESGKTALKLEIFDINELISRTLFTFEARIYEKQMEVEIKFALDQYYVEADSAQISQVLRNLIDNAIKYSPDGRRLRIATYAMHKEVYVSIQDFGQGIPEEDVPYVFDRFYKVEKAHTPTKQSGTGLGLSIVKRIIDQHGQTISLKSARGKGSTFTFTLKRAAAPKR